jgi:hypothetical protein
MGEQIGNPAVEFLGYLKYARGGLAASGDVEQGSEWLNA